MAIKPGCTGGAAMAGFAVQRQGVWLSAEDARHYDVSTAAAETAIDRVRASVSLNINTLTGRRPLLDRAVLDLRAIKQVLHSMEGE